MLTQADMELLAECGKSLVNGTVPNHDLYQMQLALWQAKARVVIAIAIGVNDESGGLLTARKLSLNCVAANSHKDTVAFVICTSETPKAVVTELEPGMIPAIAAPFGIYIATAKKIGCEIDV